MASDKEDVSTAARRMVQKILKNLETAHNLHTEAARLHHATAQAEHKLQKVGRKLQALGKKETSRKPV
jgi:hypothetical protein